MHRITDFVLSIAGGSCAISLLFQGCATEPLNWESAPEESPIVAFDDVVDDVATSSDVSSVDAVIPVADDTTGEGDGGPPEDIAPFVPPELPKAGIAAQLGNGDGSPESVTLRVILSKPWLHRPTDLAFDPLQDAVLWVTNAGDDSLVVIDNPGVSAEQHQTKFIDYYHYFNDGVLSLSFSRTSTFATCAEFMGSMNGTRDLTDQAGPVLWSGNPDVFAWYNEAYPGGPHIDMMLSSPSCKGVAWKDGQSFYAFNGEKGHLDLYDFQHPHDPGWGDSSDGVKKRVFNGLLSGVDGVPGHMEVDPETHWLYVADTGNSRILRVDTKSGTPGVEIFANPDPGTSYYNLKDVVVEDWLSAESGLLSRPSGLAIHAGTLFVSDNANGKIFAFDGDGELINSLDTGRGSDAIGGIAFGPDGYLYFVDMERDEVVRVEP